jgi:hypothetical protein
MNDTFWCCIEFTDEAGIDGLEAWQAALEPLKPAMWTCPGCGKQWAYILITKTGGLLGSWRDPNNDESLIVGSGGNIEHATPEEAMAAALAAIKRSE